MGSLDDFLLNDYGKPQTGKEPEVSKDKKNDESYLEKFNALEETLNKKTEAALSKIDKIKEDTFEAIDRQRASVIESLSVFVALFTFVSIEFQILHKLTSWSSAASLTLILLGSLLLFCGVIEKIMNWNNSLSNLYKLLDSKEALLRKIFRFFLSRTFILIILPILFVCLGILIMYKFSDDKSTNIEQNSIGNNPPPNQVININIPDKVSTDSSSTR